jgi:hypothetical protein
MRIFFTMFDNQFWGSQASVMTQTSWSNMTWIIDNKNIECASLRNENVSKTICLQLFQGQFMLSNYIVHGFVSRKQDNIWSSSIFTAPLIIKLVPLPLRESLAIGPLDFPMGNLKHWVTVDMYFSTTAWFEDKLSGRGILQQKVVFGYVGAQCRSVFGFFDLLPRGTVGYDSDWPAPLFISTNWTTFAPNRNNGKNE